MFTTGSKLFIGATTLAVVGALVYGVTQDNSTVGTIGLIAAAVALVALTGFNFWVRDCNVSAMDTGAIDTSSAAQRAPQRSFWPLIAAFGIGVIPVGLIVGRAIVWAGVIIILAATVEWMVQAWSERASGDAAYNDGIRKRVLHPLELPLLGALGLGLIIFSFSRIMLWLPSAAGAIVFGAIAASLLAFGALIANNRNVATSLVIVLCALGGVSIVTAGVATAVVGGRPIEAHEVPDYQDGTCEASQTEADDHASELVSAKSSLSVTVVLENGELRAFLPGVDLPLTTITLPRSLDSFIRFKNLDDGDYRLLASLGTEVVDATTDPPVVREEKVCTQAVGQGGAQFLVVNASRPSIASEQPYTLTVPGLDTTIIIEVP